MIQRKALAELIGTAMLLIAVVGSGIMGETLASGNQAIALLANAIATGAMLFVIITIFTPISGAHFNPAVTLFFSLRGEISLKDSVIYILMHIIGGIIGVWLTHFMFDLPILQTSETMHRTGSAQWGSEIIATLGLLLTINGGLKSRPESVPMLVALYITGAYWFTSSTSFANPAVTLARGLSNTFAGIYPAHVLVFISMQLIGVLVSIKLCHILFSDRRSG